MVTIAVILNAIPLLIVLVIISVGFFRKREEQRKRKRELLEYEKKYERLRNDLLESFHRTYKSHVSECGKLIVIVNDTIYKVKGEVDIPLIHKIRHGIPVDLVVPIWTYSEYPENSVKSSNQK